MHKYNIYVGRLMADVVDIGIVGMCTFYGRHCSSNTCYDLSAYWLQGKGTKGHLIFDKFFEPGFNDLKFV